MRRNGGEVVTDDTMFRKQQYNQQQDSNVNTFMNWGMRSNSSSLLPGMMLPNNQRRSIFTCTSMTALVVILVVFSFVYIIFFGQLSSLPTQATIEQPVCGIKYNATYPLSLPITTNVGMKFRIAVIADLDTSNFDKSGVWFSFLLRGWLYKSYLKDDHSSYRIEWDSDPVKLTSRLNEKGRGMELSELTVFNGKLYTIDDRTGLVYEVVEDNVFPRFVLTDGNGNVAKGFKSEWATVKDEQLYIGGLGKEWTTTQGVVVNSNPQWVKCINRHGTVKHINWVNHFNALREATGTSFPGYMIHESAVWSNLHRRWFFLPRRASSESYNESDDERRGTNIMISCNDNFENIKKITVGELKLTHGFSSFKFIPNTKDHEIIALKTEELEGRISTYVVVFDLEGNILMDEIKLPGDYKFEGVEFI